MKLAIVPDKMISNLAEFVKSEGSEILCRRVCAWKRASSDVKGADDWRQKKGSEASHWK